MTGREDGKDGKGKILRRPSFSPLAFFLGMWYGKPNAWMEKSTLPGDEPGRSTAKERAAAG